MTGRGKDQGGVERADIRLERFGCIDPVTGLGRCLLRCVGATGAEGTGLTSTRLLYPTGRSRPSCWPPSAPDPQPPPLPAPPPPRYSPTAPAPPSPSLSPCCPSRHQLRNLARRTCTSPAPPAAPRLPHHIRSPATPERPTPLPRWPAHTPRPRPCSRPRSPPRLRPLPLPVALALATPTGPLRPLPRTSSSSIQGTMPGVGVTWVMTCT